MKPLSEQRIRQYSPYQFEVSYPTDTDLIGFVLRMNFQPLIEAYQLTGNFLLLHWQARPRPQRRWGCFEQSEGKTRYISFLSYQCDEALFQKGLQLDERETIFVPTACIYFRDSRILVENGFATLLGI